MVRPDDPYRGPSGPPDVAGPPPAWGGPPAPGWPPQRPARSPWWIVALVALITVPVTLLLILLLMPDRGSGHGASSSPRDSDVPAALVGAWTGSVTAAAYPGIPVATQLTLVEGGVGEVVGSVSGTAFGATCSATLTLVGADASLLRLSSGAPTGPGCPQAAGSVELTVRSDGSLVYEETSALGTATGVLRRVG